MTAPNPPATGAPHADYHQQFQRHDLLVSTMNDLPGYRVTYTHGTVFGLVVRSRNLFSNVGASFRTIFGGEARGYTQLLSDTRNEALDRMCAQAVPLGANAILMMRFDTGVFANVMNEVAAYGTAVTVEPLAAPTNPTITTTPTTPPEPTTPAPPADQPT